MSEHEKFSYLRDERSRVAAASRAAHIAHIGKELMDAFNHSKTDPSDMAILGHDTMTGYEFNIERDGVTYTISVTRDWDT